MSCTASHSTVQHPTPLKVPVYLSAIIWTRLCPLLVPYEYFTPSLFSCASRAGSFYPHLEKKKKKTWTAHAACKLFDGTPGSTSLDFITTQSTSLLFFLFLRNLRQAVLCGQVTQIPTVLLPFAVIRDASGPTTDIRRRKTHSWKRG